jgi:hypothetical protein
MGRVHNFLMLLCMGLADKRGGLQNDRVHVLLYGGWLFLRRSGLAAAGAARSAAGSMQEK